MPRYLEAGKFLQETDTRQSEVLIKFTQNISSNSRSLFRNVKRFVVEKFFELGYTAKSRCLDLENIRALTHGLNSLRISTKKNIFQTAGYLVF